MQLRLASILSCSALLVGLLPQPDWKPYSSPEGGFVASRPDEARTGTLAAETGAGRLFTHLNEYLVSWTDYPRNVESKATEKTFGRMRDALMRQKEGKLMPETASMLAGHRRRSVTFADNAGRARVRFDFNDDGEFELLAQSRSKDKRANPEKLFASFNINVAEIVKRELKKGLIDSEREACPERRKAKHEVQAEFVRSERSESLERTEAKRQSRDDVISSERPERAERDESRP